MLSLEAMVGLKTWRATEVKAWEAFAAITMFVINRNVV